MTRHVGLDAARAIAMLFVVATHAALSFMVTPIGWAIQDRSQHLGVDLYVWIVRAFAMPTFMWLAGYFSRALLDGRGVRAFVRNRLTRIALPLVVLVVPMSIGLGLVWDWGRAVGERAEVAAHIPKLQRSEVAIVLGHLWFLYYLLWLSLGAFVLSRLARAPARLPVLAVPFAVTTGVLLVAGRLHTDTPMGFVPDVSILLYMGAFFAWGWLVQGRPDELARYGRRAWHALGVAPLLLAPVVLALYHATAPVPAIVASAAFSIVTVAGLLGLCVRYCVQPRRLVRLASDASYWCYVVHVPVVVLLQVALARVPLPGPIKYVAIVAVTAVVSFGSHAIVQARRRSRVR